MTFYLLCIVTVVLDQASKWFVVHHVENQPVLGDVVRLTLTENAGAAFGLFPGARTSFIAISLVAAIGLVYANHVMRRADRRRILLSLILGGNLGNLVDRIRFGRVTDFIDIGIGNTRWPVFNVADIAVVIGAVGLGLMLLAEVVQERRTRRIIPPTDAVAEENSADAG